MSVNVDAVVVQVCGESPRGEPLWRVAAHVGAYAAAHAALARELNDSVWVGDVDDGTRDVRDDMGRGAGRRRASNDAVAPSSRNR